MNKIQSHYFSQLTGIRAIAAYMVFIHHYNFLNPKYFGSIIHGMASELHIGVTFFFVLSGFLIAYRYSDMNTFTFKQYLTYRLARIYPVYFVFTVITFISISSYSNKDWIVFLLNITFLRGFFEQLKFSLVAQGWSLTVEETFYLLAPLFFIFLNKSKSAFIFIPLLSIIVGLSIRMIFKDFHIAGFFESFEFVFNYTFFGRVFEFTAGILLAYLLKSNIELPPISLYVGISFCILSIYALFRLQNNGEYDFGIRTDLGKLINTVILPFLGIVPLFYGLITTNSVLSRILGSKIFQILGKSSYVFYLIHMGIIHSVIGKYLSSNLLIHFFIIQVISIIVWRYFEEPINLFVRKKFTVANSK